MTVFGEFRIQGVVSTIRRIYSDLKFFRARNFWGYKFFRAWNFSGLEIFLGSKFFRCWGFSVQKGLGVGIFSEKEIFWLNFFLSLRFSSWKKTFKNYESSS